MTLRTLLDRFDLLLDTPESVPKLRRFILRLAVQGKLTDRNPEDTPADVLLVSVRETKRRLYDEGKIRKPKTVDPVTREEEPFDLPHSWTWSRFNDVATIVSDRVDPENHPDKPHVSPAKVEKKTGRLLGYNTIAEDGVTSSKSRFQPGQIVYSKIRPNLSKAIIAEFKGLCSADMYPVRSHIETRYLHWYMLSDPFTQQVTDEDNRVAMPKTNQSELRRVAVPLPPPEEQQRIVDTVDGLMDECDALAEQQEREHTLQVQVGSAATEALQSADDADALRPAWERVRTHFDTVTATSEGVDALRQTILQLAVQGRLTERDPDDTPAEVLLEQIQQEKQRLYEEGEIRKPKGAPSITEAEGLPALPSKWCWAPLSDLIYEMKAGSSPACKNHPAETGKWGVLRTTAVQEMEYRQYENKELPDDKEPRTDQETQAGDLLITRAGPRHRVGVACHVEETRAKLMYSDKIIRCLTEKTGALPKYLALAVNSGLSNQFIDDNKSGMAESQMNISQTNLRATPIPVAPSEEQQRIVETADRLLPFCDDLDHLLSESSMCGEQLLGAALQEANAVRPAAATT